MVPSGVNVNDEVVETSTLGVIVCSKVWKKFSTPSHVL
jgi:hypothetical protein